MSADITLKQGEAKTLTFTITDANGDAVDVSLATMTFTMKDQKSDASALVTIVDGSFDKTDGANGIVTCPISATQTNQTPGKYTGELKTQISASNIDKSSDILIRIIKATDT